MSRSFCQQLDIYLIKKSESGSFQYDVFTERLIHPENVLHLELWLLF
jgi:hypothetical protein